MACPVHRAKQAPPLFVNGSVQFQAHHVGWIVAGGFTIVAVVASFWLIQKHAKWYCVKPQQRHIIRLLLMVPIYSIITLASYIFTTHATSFLLIRDAYESVVLASFFMLMLQYLPGPVPPPPPSHNRNRSANRSWHSHSRTGSHRTEEDIEESQPINSSTSAETTDLTKSERRAAIHRTFHNLEMHPNPLSTSPTGKPALKWIWPLGSIRSKPRDGLRYLQFMKWGILQYCLVRPGSALAAVILQQFDLYCETSWGVRWGHVWIVTTVSISVTIAMYCLIQLYVTISQELKPYRPLLKLFSVKAVVFLTFWQGALLSGLASLNIIKDTEYMTAEDITIGFGALLQTLEMMCFAFIHIKAFSYHPYKRLALSHPPSALIPASSAQQFKNLGHAFDFTDTFKDIYSGILYHLGKGPSKEADDACRRGAGFREVFGRERVLPGVLNRGGAVTGEVEDKDGDDSLPRSFVRTRGYRGVPTNDEVDERYTSMRAVIRPIQRPAPELLPTPQTSPTGDESRPSMVGLRLDDPPPVSVWRGQAGVRPLPPGAYIPRIPGSPGPWMPGGASQRSDYGTEGQRPVMVTPPPTPPMSPPGATTASPQTVQRQTVMTTVSGASSRPLAPNVRLSAIPNPGARSPRHILRQESPRHTIQPESPRHSLYPESPRHTFQPDSARQTLYQDSPRHTLQPSSPRYTMYLESPGNTLYPDSPRHTLHPNARTPSPALSISDDMRPPSRDDSLLARVFSGQGPRSAETGYTGRTALETITGSGDTESTKSSSYRTAVDGASSRPESFTTSASGGRSSGTASYRTWERAIVRTGQAVVLEPDGQNGYRPRPASPETPASETSRPSSFGSLLSPPSPPRPLRRVGPNIESRKQDLGAQTCSRGPSIQPRTIVLPTPLSPARYPHSPWRTPAPPETRPVHWSLLQQNMSSSDSGLAGRAAGRTAIRRNENSVFPTNTNISSSLSSLSNIEDRYPTMSAQGPRDLGMRRK